MKLFLKISTLFHSNVDECPFCGPVELNFQPQAYKALKGIITVLNEQAGCRSFVSRQNLRLFTFSLLGSPLKAAVIISMPIPKKKKDLSYTFTHVFLNQCLPILFRSVWIVLLSPAFSDVSRLHSRESLSILASSLANLRKTLSGVVVAES